VSASDHIVVSDGCNTWRKQLVSQSHSSLNSGSQCECFYVLVSFGIPVKAFPIEVDGAVSTDVLLKQIKRYRMNEEADKAQANGSILFPLCNDVLLGRGRPYQEFPGNRRMAELVEEHREVHQSGSKLEKTALANKITYIIKDPNGRFLKKTEGENGDWVEVTDKVAREKVSHAFRTKTRRNTPVVGKLSWQHLLGRPISDEMDELTCGSESKKPRLSPSNMEEVVSKADM
jgi:hypothetical protein